MTPTPSVPSVPTSSAREVKASLAAEPAPLLVDVREEWEFAQSHIEGAVWAPLSRLPEASEQLQAHRSGPLVTYCHHGVRSAQAAAWLLAHGFEQVSSMDGGIDAWALDVDNSVGRY